MGLFSFGSGTTRYGVLIDIGSGSVLTAIVASTEGAPDPAIIWAHRELAPLKHITELKDSAKGVMAALVNACMRLDSEGRKALQQSIGNVSLTHMQVAISAPWCYTVSKTISYKQEESFSVTKDLINELIRTTEQQVEAELLAHETASHLGLKVITRGTMDVLTNGYRVRNPDHELAKTLELSQATVVAQQYLVDAIDELQTKLFTRSSVNKLSFMLQLYCTAREVLPYTDDVCLIDITYEATEMGIIRDGSLHFSTHTAFGLYSLAREIAAVTHLPLTEVFNRLRSKEGSDFSEQSAAVQEEIKSVFSAYCEKVTALFNETGDTLSIPKKIFLNVDHGAEPLVQSLIERAAKKATKVEHAITSAATALHLEKSPLLFHEGAAGYQNDTALLLSARFFHKPTRCLEFSYV